MELLIEDDWYATPDSQQILFALKKISDNQDKYFTMISQMNDKIDDLSKQVQVLSEYQKELKELKNNQKLENKQRLDEKDVKKIKEMLQELNIIKEREINVLLREHIPFPFLLKRQSPISRLLPFSSMKRPFSTNQLPKE